MTSNPSVKLPFENAVALFSSRVSKTPDRVGYKSKVAGTWRSGTWRDWDRASREIAAGLADLGVVPGDRVIILANTREEWGFADVGILMAGAITVPIYPSSLPEQCEYIIRDSGAKIIIVEDPSQLEKLLDPEVRDQITNLERVVLISDSAQLDRPDAKGRRKIALGEVLPKGHKDEDWVTSLAELKSNGKAWLENNSLEPLSQGLNLESVSTIVYTSGTTGEPKGVVLTHKNLVFESTEVIKMLDVTEDDEQLLFLPLAHILAKVLLWVSFPVGMTVIYAESVPKLIANMGEVKPTIMGAVPRVFEKAYAKVKANFEEKRKSPLGKLIIDRAVTEGKKRPKMAPGSESEYSLMLRLMDKLVYSKVRDTFGGRLRFFVSGGAPLAGEIAEFFHEAGILVLEGYGLTETTAATHLNNPSSYRFGTVGPAVPGVEVKIASDGEILMRGPNIMKEYYGKPDATARAMESDGWFHTGDIGVVDDDGHLRITDRKKDIIVTAGGKNIAPQYIENLFKTLCPLASQMMVYGDKRKYLSALVTLNEDLLMPWAKANGLESLDYETLTQHEKVLAEINKDIEEMNGDLPRWETVKKFKILPKDFDQDSGELTPTLKVKRKFCSKKYKDILESFYSGPETTL